MSPALLRLIPLTFEFHPRYSVSLTTRKSIRSPVRLLSAVSRFSKLASRLTQLGLPPDPFELPAPVWLHLAVPTDVPRTLLLPDDGLVLSDLAELHNANLRGKVAAVFGRQRRAQTTADEHKEYTRKVDLPPGTSRTPSTRCWRTITAQQVRR